MMWSNMALLDDLEFPVLTDPLASVAETEHFLWSHLRARITNHRTLVATNSNNRVDFDRIDVSDALMQRGDEEEEGIVAESSSGGESLNVTLRVGERVTRGRDWIWGRSDGGAGNVGSVVEVRESSLSRSFALAKREEELTTRVGN